MEVTGFVPFAVHAEGHVAAATQQLQYAPFYIGTFGHFGLVQLLKHSSQFKIIFAGLKSQDPLGRGGYELARAETYDPQVAHVQLQAGEAGVIAGSIALSAEIWVKVVEVHVALDYRVAGQMEIGAFKIVRS